MSQTSNITAAMQRIRDEFNTHKGIQGALASLNTTDKSSLVNAINEVISSAGVSINDAAQNANEVWSSNKIVAEINSAVATIVGGAGLDDDTLGELATKIANLQLADAGLVSVDSAQSFTTIQEDQGRANIAAASQADMTTAQADILGNTSAASTAQSTANTAVTNAATAQTAADAAQLDVDALETAVGDTTHNFVTDFTTGLN